MLRLLILRHSKAEPLSPVGGDHERALAPRGHEDAGKMGAFLARHALAPSHAVLSSARRVQETWHGVASALDNDVSVQTDRRLYNAAAEKIFAVIRDMPAVSSAMVVGHNPGLHEVAVWLIASGDAELRERLAEGLPTSGLVVIDFPAASWTAVAPNGGRLERFVTPGTLSPATD